MLQVKITKPDCYKSLQHLVPHDIPVGPADSIPGLISTCLPALPGNFSDELMNKRRTIFAHNVRISSMQDVESNFTAYLRKLCMPTEEQPSMSVPVSAHVTERKFTVCAHNTWRQSGQTSMISLQKDLNG